MGSNIIHMLKSLTEARDMILFKKIIVARNPIGLRTVWCVYFGHEFGCKQNVTNGKLELNNKNKFLRRGPDKDSVYLSIMASFPVWMGFGDYILPANKPLIIISVRKLS